MSVFAWIVLIAIFGLALLFLLGMVLLPTLDEEPDSEELWNDLEDLEDDGTTRN